MNRILVPTALTLAMLTITAHAADVSASANVNQQLPVIVVTASKTPENINDIPARISVIDNKAIQQSTVQSLGQLLQQDAALNVVQSGGMGQQTSIFTRSTESRHTLVMEDGVRLNTGSQSLANIPFLDLSNISRVEVLKGPASVQYGSDAIGGVVQLISETPKKQHLFTTVEAGEQHTYKTVAGADLVQDDAYFQVRGQRLESNGSPATNASGAPDASYDQKGYSVKGGIDNALYAASAEYKENKGANQYDNYGTPAAQDFYNRLIQVKGRYNLTPLLQINARWSKFEDELNQKNENYLGQLDFTNTDAQEADLNLQWQTTPAQNILFGATRRWTDVNSLSYGNRYDKTLNTIGYYLQHQYNQNGLSTQAGIRVEDDQQFGTHTVGQLAARYQLLPTTSIYANVGSAFKAPRADDLYGYGGNTALKPEQSLSYEIGIDQNINNNLKAYISAYQTKIKNMFNSVCLTTSDCNNYIFHMVNIDKATLTGGEAGLKWQFHQWFTNAEYAYVSPINDETKEDLSRRPRQTVTLSAGWDNQIYGVSASLVAKSKSDNSIYDDVKIPGSVSGNLHIYWQATPYAKLFANVENIGDTTIKTAYGSGGYYIAAPRLATAGVTFSY